MKKTLQRLLLPVCLMLTGANPIWAAPAHVHGESQLEITIDGNAVAITLISPLDNLLGFEHNARTPKEQVAVRTMRTQLAQSDRQFVLNPEAACVAAPPDLSSPVFGNGKADGHMDLEGRYSWQCQKPAALRSIDVRLFNDFPRTTLIKVQLIGPSGQRSGQLTAQQPRFSW